MLLPIHIAAGGLALVLGAVALMVKKGGTIHRRSGLLFVYAMLIMGVSAVSPWTRRINVAAVTVPVALTLLGIMAGVKAHNSPRGVLNGVPFVMHFFIATVRLLAAAGDVRIMRIGVPRGGPRLARHLWRMCFALFIAAGSFFSVRRSARDSWHVCSNATPSPTNPAA